MQACLSFLVLLFSALLLLASPAFSAEGSAPSGEGVSPRCEAAIDKAAGRYSQCLLKASAKYAKKKNQSAAARGILVTWTVSWPMGSRSRVQPLLRRG